MSLISAVTLTEAVCGAQMLNHEGALEPVWGVDWWILHRHRAGARKVRRVLRRHQQRVRAGWAVSAREWTPEELS